MTYYLAIDIGASSGRHILSKIKNNKIEIEEIYRFKNNYNINLVEKLERAKNIQNIEFLKN